MLEFACILFAIFLLNNIWSNYKSIELLKDVNSNLRDLNNTYNELIENIKSVQFLVDDPEEGWEFGYGDDPYDPYYPYDPNENN